MGWLLNQPAWRIIALMVLLLALLLFNIFH
jgi:hypothetical protein